MSTVWFLIVFGSHQGMAVVPHSYPTEALCKQAGDSVKEDRVIAYLCVWAPA